MGQELQPSLRASELVLPEKTPEDYGAAPMQKYRGQTSMFCKEVQFTTMSVPPVTSRTACQHASETPSPHLALPRLASPCHVFLDLLGITEYAEGHTLPLAFLPWHSTWFGVIENTDA